ncbi:MAG: SCO family protein, partial [Rhodocyclaceae bacterium]|nr:SCO family protein [Rhodocyclaceae bacterium]
DFFDPRIVALTGQPALIARVAQNYKVRYEIVRDPHAAPEAYSVDHSAGLYLLDTRGDFLKKFAFGTPVEQIAATIDHFIDQAPPPRH